MIDDQPDGVEMIGINTALKDLNACNGKKVQIGKVLTRGLGAGANPEIGKQAAIEGIEDITTALKGADMVIIVCGMGGGTGTGAAPVVAEKAKELGLLTVAIVTKPFTFEGGVRSKNARQGIEEIKKYADSLFVISNDNILKMADKRISFPDALKMGDEVLRQTILSITDIINITADINVDFADIRTVMTEKGEAYIGTGEAGGDQKALEAVKKAVENPLLDTDIMGASDLIISMSGDVTIGDTNDAISFIQQKVGEDTNIIFGSRFDKSKPDNCVISVIATGVKTSKASGPSVPYKAPSITGVSAVPNKSAVSKPVISSEASTVVKKPANIRPLAFSPAPVTARASETQVKSKPLMIPEFLKRVQRKGGEEHDDIQ